MSPRGGLRSEVDLCFVCLGSARRFQKAMLAPKRDSRKRRAMFERRSITKATRFVLFMWIKATSQPKTEQRTAQNEPSPDSGVVRLRLLLIQTSARAPKPIPTTRTKARQSTPAGTPARKFPRDADRPSSAQPSDPPAASASASASASVYISTRSTAQHSMARHGMACRRRRMLLPPLSAADSRRSPSVSNGTTRFPLVYGVWCTARALSIDGGAGNRYPPSEPSRVGRAARLANERGDPRPLVAVSNRSTGALLLRLP